MSTTKVEQLKVPGATLHCEISGSGPVLLLIPGAPADAGAFGAIAAQLSQKYTVIAYDLRGLSRSTLDGPPEDLRMDVLGDDAHRILDAYANGEPAYVLGCSGGAMVGLELVVQHPEQVRALVAHEPPVVELLPSGPQWRSFVEELEQTYQAAGAGPAMGKFIAAVEGIAGPGVENTGEPVEMAPPPMPDMSQLPPEMLEMMGRMQANVEVFFAHQLRAATRYVPDTDALSKAPTRVVIAVGAASEGQAPHEAGVQVAKQLGTDPVEFPGDHQGFATHSDAFAAAVDRILSEN